MKDKQEKNSRGSKASRQSHNSGLLHELGLVHTSGCYLNTRFMLALLIAVVFLLAFHDFMPPFSSSINFNWMTLLSIIVWQPLIEELLFRGVIQGQLTKREWGRRSWQGISNANIITSVLFVAVHMIHSSPLAALSVMAPSLVFGYFRDYCNSVFPSIILHSAYNAMVFVGLILYGNMKLPSM